MKNTLTNEILKKHFSHCFDKKGNFNFNKFKNELEKNNINFSEERYELNWLGKSYAKLLANEEPTTFLKADEQWNNLKQNKNSENILIKGDNLEVLKHLLSNYREKIKMIYIDPPYNTGNDGFIYKDNKKFTVNKLVELAGINEKEAKNILDFINSKSNSHSAWLTFMYPRLYIARQLLREDGVIFVSIDNNEVAQLRLLMDEIFGEENFICEFIWKSKSGGAADSTYIAVDTEYILCYSKNKLKTKLNRKIQNTDNKLYKYKDNNYLKYGKFKLRNLDETGIRYSKTLDFPIIIKNNKIIINNREIKLKKDNLFNFNIPNNEITLLPGGSKNNLKKYTWRWSENKIINGLDKGYLVFVKNRNGDYKLKQKQYEYFNTSSEEIVTIRTTPYRNLIDFINTTAGTIELKKLFNGLKLFNYPKPTKLIKYLLNISTNKNNNDIILDFFAGSGTTGDAVMQLNAEDNGNRKYILIQIPELINQKNKITYDFIKNTLEIEHPTIFEITKERLIRAGNKIKEENNNSENIDLGFKVFKLINKN